MESEKIRIVDKEGKHKGTATRKEIHRKGFWHETFHCWVVTKEEDRYFIHLQLRSSMKKDFPGLFDITAAGHILADEAIEDGIREVEEELGIKIAFDELVPLGVIKDQIVQSGFIDNERCHTFLYMAETNLDETCELQREEVAGMVQADFASFYALCVGDLEEIEVKGFQFSSDQQKIEIRKMVGKNDLVPHSRGYLKKVAQKISREL